MSLNLTIRRVFPSTSKLTYNPVARRVLDAFDDVPKRVSTKSARIEAIFTW